MARIDDIGSYIERGFSLVPFRAIRPEGGGTKWGKRPLVKWESRAQTRPDPETVIAEFKKHPDALIGCCTGDVSGIVNLDVDSDEGRAQADELVPDSLMVPTYKTISGGLQMIFRAAEGDQVGRGEDQRDQGIRAGQGYHRLGKPCQDVCADVPGRAAAGNLDCERYDNPSVDAVVYCHRYRRKLR